MTLKRALDSAKQEARKLGYPLVVINDDIGEAEDGTGPFMFVPAKAMENPYRYGIMPGAEVVYNVAADGTATPAQIAAKIKGAS